MNLDQDLTTLFRPNKNQIKALERLGIKSLRDLLYHFPARYGDTAVIKNISDISAEESVTLYGKISNLKTGKTFKSKMAKSTATLTDETGEINITWFRQAYLAKMLRDGSFVKVSGKATLHKDKLTLNNPKVEGVNEIPIGVGDSLFSNVSEDNHSLYPVYNTSKGLTTNWIYHAILKILSNSQYQDIVDPIPQQILSKYNLPNLKTALIWMHTPKKESDALSARKRFAFEEVFMIQLKNQLARQQNSHKKTFIIESSPKEIEDFIGHFPFPLTKSQEKSVKDILKDFKSGQPMSRLLEGDVGSGKTAVAATAIYATLINRPVKGKDFGHLQTAYMVPTEILAKQHFNNFIQFFNHLNIKIGLITSSGCYKFPSKIKDPNTGNQQATKISRAQLLKWVENGEIPILIGTHSLIQKSVKFQNLALIIIDEQHRFGTLQRQKLARKDDFVPHLLSMTATPIPRTLALTLYGDLDLSLLDQMPLGRKPIITEVVLPDDKSRQQTYEKVRTELEAGRQAYVICPRIDEPDPNKQTALNVKSVKAEAKRLKEKVFKEYNIDILHSKMKNDEKEKVMKDFESGKTDILVATSVVEVGVNVPNATVIIIEGAERFGLSQLHQLRGRVIRSNHQAYAYVFADTKSQKSVDRLKALESAKNGFELSEFDLQFRGSGELYGRKQWGISDLGMEAIKNIKMVEAARNEAREIVENDLLNKDTEYAHLDKILINKKEIHFE